MEEDLNMAAGLVDTEGGIGGNFPGSCDIGGSVTEGSPDGDDRPESRAENEGKEEIERCSFAHVSGVNGTPRSRLTQTLKTAYAYPRWREEKL
jgi:hypothetical protein